ncbi:prepilin peptidase [Gulosibacter macacae]|uniref:Prepilin peptidase n=1 Tax=Gulosibacter macacae TaxID=2488791 RepID=A0A3P3VUE2_9MICO|nr:prepilin peptidase [Gulosibacter macacae]RRJ86422.1 prepilin peptidase [Gulosibacter macacae]
MLLDTTFTYTAAALSVALWVALVTPKLVVTDLAEHRLPNDLVMPGWGVAGVALVVAWLEAGEFPLVTLLTSVAALVVLIGLGLAGGFGMGDAKLAVPLTVGLLLVHPMHAAVGALAAIVTGGVAALVTLVRRRDVSQRIPFGPWLLLGYWTGYLA